MSQVSTRRSKEKNTTHEGIAITQSVFSACDQILKSRFTLQLFQYGLVFQGRGCLLGDLLTMGDGAQQAAHDLAGTCLGQVIRVPDIIRFGYRPDLLADPGTQFPGERRIDSAGGACSLEYHIGEDGLTFDLVRPIEMAASATRG